MALSLEGIENMLRQQGLQSPEPEPSFYTYGAIPSSQVNDPSTAAPLQTFARGGKATSISERNPVTPMPGTKSGTAPTGGQVVPPGGYPPGTLGSAYEPGSTLPPGVDPMAPIGDLSDPQQVNKMMALLSLLPPGTFGNMGSVADPNIAASARTVTDTGPAGGLQGQQFEEGYLETQKAGPLLGLWQSGLADVLAEDPGAQARVTEMEAERAERIAGLEQSIPRLKPLSDLLKAGQFKEAFEYAKANGLTDQLMNTDNLKNLRGPFSKEEMSAFFNAIPSDVAKEYTGEGWVFDPSAGVQGSLDPLGTGGKGAMNEGFPDPNRAFSRKDNELVKNLVKIAGAAMLATTIPGLLPGAGGGTAAGGTAAGGAAGAGGATAAGGAGALTGVIPTGLIPGTAAATAAGLTTPLVTITTGGAGAGLGTALGAGAVGAGAAAAGGGGGGSAATQPAGTTTQPIAEGPLETIEVIGTKPVSGGLVPPVIDFTGPANLTETLTQTPAPEITYPVEEPLEEVIVEGTRPGQGGLTMPPFDLVEPPDVRDVLRETPAPDVELPPEEEPLEEVIVRTRPPADGGLTMPPFDLVEPPDLKDVLKEPDINVPEEKSPLDKIKGVADKLSKLQKLMALLGGLSGIAGSKGGGGGGGGGLPVARDDGALPVYEFGRVQTRPDIDYFTYGTRPEEMFFQDTMTRVEPQPQPPPNPNLDSGIAPPDEGGPFAQGGLAEGGRYYEGKGSGRDDKIPALLSDGEYVIDAETLALLGDGSTKEGARRMDKFRAKIRKHKGNALSRGQISPNAKSPDKYMGGGLRR